MYREVECCPSIGQGQHSIHHTELCLAANGKGTHSYWIIVCKVVACGNFPQNSGLVVRIKPTFGSNFSFQFTKIIDKAQIDEDKAHVCYITVESLCRINRLLFCDPIISIHFPDNWLSHSSLDKGNLSFPLAVIMKNSKLGGSPQTTVTVSTDVIAGNKVQLSPW